MTRKTTAIYLTYGAILFILSLGCLDGVDLDGGECNPDFDDNCFCTLDEDGQTEVDDCIDGETDDGQFCTCETDDGFDDDFNNDDGNNDAPKTMRFVMLEDNSTDLSDGSPGADIDAIGLIKADGFESFAQSFSEESNVPCGPEDDADAVNDACNPNAALGEPDAIDVDTGECFDGGQPDESQFLSLNGGFVIVSFGGDEIENGDAIHIYEVGNTECGRFEDEPFTVSVSDDDLGSFLELGVSSTGDNIIEVSGL